MASAAPAEILNVVASGTRGIGELADKVDATTVSYVLCRIPIGSGSFKREKLVVLHLQMEACPPLKRGRINTKGAEVKRMLGDVNAVIQCTVPSELSLDSVLAALTRFVAADAGDVSIAKMKADYQAMIDAAGAGGGAGGAASKADGGIVLTRKTAVELGGVQGGAALKSVQVSVRRDGERARCTAMTARACPRHHSTSAASPGCHGRLQLVPLPGRRRRSRRERLRR